MVQLSADQKAVEDAGLLESGGVVMLPTGGGKTWLARRAIRQRIERGLKAVYLSPLKALARELYGAWKEEFTGYRIGLYTGEVGVDSMDDLPTPIEADVLIATPEKLDLYVRGWSDHLEWLAKIGLLVVDELHTLNTGRRGATLEGLITRLRCVNPYIDVLAMSATLGNPKELGEWLGGGHYSSTVRPIPLEWRIRPYSKNEPKADVVAEEVQETIAVGGQAIVFVQSRQRTESIVKRLQELGISAAAHHAGLSKANRDKAEAGYRKGDFSVLAATPTLSMGVNLGARKVVLHDLQRWNNGGWEDLLTNEVWQLAGRAGRPGMDSRGEVVLLAPVWNQKAARSFMKGNFETINSQLEQDAAFGEQLMVCFGSRLALKSQQAERVMAKSFAGRRYTPGEMRLRVDRAIEQMVRAGMLERNDEGYIRATRLGRIATRFQLTPQTVLAWKSLEELVSSASLFDLLLAVCVSPDFTARLRVDHGEVVDLQEALDREPMRLREMGAHSRASVLPASGKDLVSATKTALALRAWTRLGDIVEASQAVNCMEHELEDARKEAVRMLQAMIAMLTSQPRAIADDAEPDIAEKAGALAAMVCAGLDDEQATLALIDGVGPVLARRLAATGFGDVEAVAQAQPSEIATIDGISLKRATRWTQEASSLVLRGGALRYREVCGQMEKSEVDVGVVPGLDYYRWLRAQGLSVEANAEGWMVSGGSEPHEVRATGTSSYVCNCKDSQKGTRLCKHVILVMHENNEAGVPRFDAGFPAGDGRFDLEVEWSKPVMGMRQWKR